MYGLIRIKMERLEFMRSMQAETWRRTMKRKILAVSLVACLCLMASCAQIHDTVTEESQAQSAQTMQTEAADTETTEALDSTEESDTEYIDTTYTPEKIREILFGEWKVSKFLGFTKVQNDYAIYPDGHDIIGDHIVINEHTFSSERIEKYERYQCELSDPVYRVSSIKEMYAIYDISDSVEKGTKVYDMIVNESLQDVNIEGINKNDPTQSWPSVDIEISSDSHMVILYFDCEYYLLEKV
jgi:hypothetical protein